MLIAPQAPSGHHNLPLAPVTLGNPGRSPVKKASAKNKHPTLSDAAGGRENHQAKLTRSHKAAYNSASVRILRLCHTIHGPPTLASLTHTQVLSCNAIGAHTPMKINPVNFVQPKD